jgi:hypothetical protein
MYQHFLDCSGRGCFCMKTDPFPDNSRSRVFASIWRILRPSCAISPACFLLTSCRPEANDEMNWLLFGFCEVSYCSYVYTRTSTRMYEYAPDRVRVKVHRLLRIVKPLCMCIYIPDTVIGWSWCQNTTVYLGHDSYRQGWPERNTNVLMPAGYKWLAGRDDSCQALIDRSLVVVPSLKARNFNITRRYCITPVFPRRVCWQEDPTSVTVLRPTSGYINMFLHTDDSDDHKNTFHVEWTKSWKITSVFRHLSGIGSILPEVWSLGTIDLSPFCHLAF